MTSSEIDMKGGLKPNHNRHQSHITVKKTQRASRLGEIGHSAQLRQDERIPTTP